MSTNNICIRREIRKILCGYPLLPVTMIFTLSIGTNRPEQTANIKIKMQLYNLKMLVYCSTIVTLSIGANRRKQTEQTQIRCHRM